MALATDVPSGGSGDVRAVPRRVMILSATVGEGHNSTGRALEQEARRLWPDCDVRWVDTLDVMAPGLGSLTRGAYTGGVETTPWLYDFFYRATRSSRSFTALTKNAIGAWCGRRLAPVIARYAPDVIISTYPLGSTGLAWLRRHRGLPATVAAWVSDFAPHPFWVYGDVDVTYVMHERAVPVARRADPAADVRVAALPVTDGFADASRAGARPGLGLSADRFVVVLSTGCYGFGDVEAAVDALLGANPRVQVIAACGHNAELHGRLTARRLPAHRLLVLGWIDDMPRYVAACDAVVTNAGGATALEAVAAGRAVLMYQPIAGQGRANADLMCASGLAVSCATPEELALTTARLVATPDRRAAVERTAYDVAHRRNRGDDLRELAARRSARPVLRSVDPVPDTGPVPDVAPVRRVVPERTVRAEDAFFLYAQTPWVTQQVGVILLFDAPHVDSAELTARASVLLNRRKLAPGPHWWSRPVWERREFGNAGLHVRSGRLGEDGTPGTLSAAIDLFYSTPVHGMWDLQLVQDLPDGRTALLIKVHHALGDSFAMANTLMCLFDPLPGRGHRRTLAPPVPHAVGSRRHRYAAAFREAGRVISGLRRLALTGPAPKSPVSGPMNGPSRRFVSFTVPSRELMATARRLRAGSTAVVLTMIGDAVSRVPTDREAPAGERALRIMVPRTVRDGLSAADSGNWTAAVPVDVPIGPMSRRDRLAVVQQRLETLLHGNATIAANWVMRAMGILPASVHAAASRAIYNGNWFNVIVSVFPGNRVPRTLTGAKALEVYPVLPVADEVGLAVGAMTWGTDLSFGITADAALVPDAAHLGALARECYEELRDSTG